MADGGKQPGLFEVLKATRRSLSKQRESLKQYSEKATESKNVQEEGDRLSKDEWADEDSRAESDARSQEAIAEQKSAYEAFRASNPLRQAIQERVRNEQLKQSQALAAKQQSAGSPAGGMPEGGFPTLPNTPPKPAGGGEEGGDQGSPAEQLSRAQSGAANQQSLEGMMGGAGGAGGESMDPKKKIQSQIDSINHFLVVEMMPDIVSLDIACFGLLSCLTLPLYYWPVAALIGIEVYNDFTGKKEPTIPGTGFPFPRLTWKSFMSPGGTDIDIPLPTQPLWVAWVAYVALISALSIVWLGIVAMIVYAWNNPMALFSWATEMFPMFKSF